MRRVVAAGLVVALAGPAAAQEVPRGQIGMAGVVRRNLGELAERYGMGYLWGFVSGYQITRPDDRVSIGLLLATLWGRSQFFDYEFLGDDDATVADGALKYFEVSMGLRLRGQLTEGVPLYLVGSAGGALMRTHVPIAPSGARRYLGGFVGFGLEYYLGPMLLGLDTRYGLLGQGPRSVTWMLSVGLGR